jgi:hypothetical protein
LDGIFGDELPHHQRQLPVGRQVDGSRINPLHVLGGVGVTAVNLHDELGVRHLLSLLLSFATKPGGHLSTVEYTAPVRNFPHSMQYGLNRDVISPQDGHILCVPYPAIRGFGVRILCTSRIVNSTKRKPTKILVAFMETNLPVRSAWAVGSHRQYQHRGGIANVSRNRHECFCHGRMLFRRPSSRDPTFLSWSTSRNIRFKRHGQSALSLEKPKVGVLQMDWLRSEDLKEVKVATAPFLV